MNIEQRLFQQGEWKIIQKFQQECTPDLVFIFGSVSLLKNENNIAAIKEMYPNTIYTGCSTAGEIGNVFIEDDSLVVTAISFEKTNIKCACQEISAANDSFEVGRKIISELLQDDLRHVLLFSEGLFINGSQLVSGCQSILPPNINVSGGLAGDAANFKETYIVLRNGDVRRNTVTAIGFYSNDLTVGCGSIGGWDIFGIERMVTKSKDNILYEIDNAPALSLYKTFLGEKSKELPASALLFPLSVRVKDDEEPVVRTILSINEEEQSMTFAGDIPQGTFVRLMKANVNRLLDGALQAGKNSLIPFEQIEPEFSLLVSCVGRKLVLKQLAVEEIESVHDAIGNQTMITGFYSYGEIAPFSNDTTCSLHNQTMTVTTFSEK